PDPVSPATACEWVEQLADAAGHAHERGVVHRDIKPSNILLVADPDDAEGRRPVLADFGLAHVAELDAEATATGTFLGTPEYMSPEQVRGVGRPSGPAADVWSLGVVLYRLLTGRLPFVGRSRAETMLAVLF